MRPYQTRVRKMRQPGRHPGRSTDGIRQAYHDPAIRAAKAAAKAAAAEAARPGNQVEGSHDRAA